MSAKTSKRDVVAAVSCFLGVLVLASSVVLGYATRVVFDADTFAFRVSRTLQEPRVAAYVAGELSDAVIAQNRDLVAFRPILVASARSVVASEPFAAVLRRAARTAHAVVLSQSAERVYLTLPDFSVLLRAAVQSEAEFLDKLPERVQIDLSDDLDRVVGKPALAALRIGSRLTRLVWAVFSLAIALIVFGLSLASNRGAALMQTAAGMGTAAVFLFVLPVGVEKLLSFRIQDDALRSLATGVWHSLASGIRLRALVFAASAVVLTSAAWPASGRLEAGATLRNAWSLLKRPRLHVGLDLLRVLVLITLGFLLVVAPLQALRAVVIVVGALLAFEGFHALFARIAPYTERAITDPHVASGATRTYPWRWAVLTSVVLVAGVAATVFLQTPAAVPKPRFSGRCNGDAALCSRTLDQIVLPGAHNAMAAADVPGWMFPNHQHGIASQLRHGIRALLVDVHYGTPVGDAVRTHLDDETAARAKYEAVLGGEGIDAAMRIRDRLVGEPTGPRAAYLCHGFCELGAQPLEAVLRTIREFLVRNPGEVLVVVIEDNVAPADVAAAFEASSLVDFVYRGVPQPPWPTLGEMVASDQRIVVLAENDATGVPWYHATVDVMQETPYSNQAVVDFSCAPNRGGTRGSLFLLNHWIDSAPAPKPSNAEIVNARDFLLQRVRRCEAARGRFVNVIAVDFHATGDVVDVARTINRSRLANR